MSYLQLYIYRIQEVHREEFLNTMRKVRDIYRKYGVNGEELFLLNNRTSKYGLTGLWEILSTTEDEEIWLGLDHYKNTEHCKEVMKAVDSNPEINTLYNQIVKFVCSASRIVLAEFENIDY